MDFAAFLEIYEENRHSSRVHHSPITPTKLPFDLRAVGGDHIEFTGSPTDVVLTSTMLHNYGDYAVGIDSYEIMGGFTLVTDTKPVVAPGVDLVLSMSIMPIAGSISSSGALVVNTIPAQASFTVRFTFKLPE